MDHGNVLAKCNMGSELEKPEKNVLHILSLAFLQRLLREYGTTLHSPLLFLKYPKISKTLGVGFLLSRLHLLSFLI